MLITKKIPQNLVFLLVQIQISGSEKPTSANFKNQQTKNQRFHANLI